LDWASHLLSSNQLFDMNFNFKDFTFLSNSQAYFSYEMNLHLFDCVICKNIKVMIQEVGLGGSTSLG